jgi:hypothetical protein
MALLFATRSAPFGLVPAAGAVLLVAGCAALAFAPQGRAQLAGLAGVAASFLMVRVPEPTPLAALALFLVLAGLGAAAAASRGHPLHAAPLVAACVAVAALTPSWVAPGLVDARSPGFLGAVALLVGLPALAVAVYRHRNDEIVRSQ